MGAIFAEHISGEPHFVNNIETARCVLLAPHRISLKEFTSLRKKPEVCGRLFTVTAREYRAQTPAEDLFWRRVSLNNFTVQDLKGLREDRLLSYVSRQRDLRIEFAHLIAER
ncbi:LOW QUALITY PROTEIN: Hypothetical protein PHPALM_8596 [Phytophthora palmivora]|uniref:ATP-binding cassette (ABC) Superfamily n=1 Tax=Phytophthora palmivora TaxID=4796 RepID=A0A2P4Y9E8_9STRA|nr:LOW QUALITY PROTEIN: Hypothetical protein PHPALM_8596 [Phytophthora palmivora]